MRALAKSLRWAGITCGVVLLLLVVLLWVEASVGHDGLLCEMGYDKDGSGALVTGCG